MVNEIVAFIPARAGSKRIPGKNIKHFFDHPLIAYSIQSALDSGVFENSVYVTSDSMDILKIAEYYGAIPIYRPEMFSGDESPDREWIDHALSLFSFSKFAILRPTSPFRSVDMIKSAYLRWDKSSLMKCVEPVKNRPEKMWRIFGNSMFPFWDTISHLNQSSTFQKLYVQNGALEFRNTENIDGRYGCQPFFADGYQSFDINVPDDLVIAKILVEKGLATLPKIEKESYAESETKYWTQEVAL